MVTSWLLVNFIQDHATNIIISLLVTLERLSIYFWNYGEIPALPILQITFNFSIFFGFNCGKCCSKPINQNNGTSNVDYKYDLLLSVMDKQVYIR